jgi:predicted nucleic acid-binding protein
MTAVVCNASPLIVLAKAALLDLLPRLFDPIYLPAAVEAELACGPAGDPMRSMLPGASWLRSVRCDPPLSPLAAWQLGAGEAEVIEYARLHPQHAVILDDRVARRAALGIGLPVYGTLSVLALARHRGLISVFRAAVADVVRAGLYVQPALIDTVAAELGE